MGRENYRYLPLTESQFDSLKNQDESGKQKYEIRQRIQHTLMNGHTIWSGLGIDQTTFKTVDKDKNVTQTNVTQALDQSEVEKTRQLQRGLIGWLAFLYAGIEERPHLKRLGNPEYVTQRRMKGPNTYFDFESILREAINKVENRKGKYVTDLSLEVETEPIPNHPVGEVDTDELLTRFNDRDPTLTGMEIAYLQREGEIDKSDWKQYTEEAYSHSQLEDGLFGVDDELLEGINNELDDS